MKRMEDEQVRKRNIIFHIRKSAILWECGAKMFISIFDLLPYFFLIYIHINLLGASLNSFLSYGCHIILQGSSLNPFLSSGCHIILDVICTYLMLYISDGTPLTSM